MNFGFPDENIMLVTDCEEPGLEEGPEEGSRWSIYFDGASNALGNVIATVIISPEGCHTPFTAIDVFLRHSVDEFSNFNGILR